MKKKIRGLLMLVIFCLLTAFPVKENVLAAETEETAVVAEGSWGETLTWKLTSDGALIISGNGEMKAPHYTEEFPWYEYRSDAQKIIIEDGVTTISERAFYEFKYVKSVFIPASVTSIEPYAFFVCSSLQEFHVADESLSFSSLDGALYNKEATKFMLLPGGKTNVTISESVSGFDSYSFVDRMNLESIDVDSENPNYSSVDGVLYNKEQTKLFICPGKRESLQVPETVNIIGNSAFYACSSLKNIILPENFTTIGNYTFGYCTGLSEIDIPDTVQSIGGGAFEGCEKLTKITLPSQLTEISYMMFIWCTNLKEIVLPGTITDIGESAFHECNALSDVYYCGRDMEEWRKIQIVENGNEILNSVDFHLHVGDSMESVTAACTNKGYLNGVCERCGAEYDHVEFPMLEHTYGEDGRCKICRRAQPSVTEFIEDGGTWGDNITWEIKEGTLYLNGEGPMMEDKSFDPCQSGFYWTNDGFYNSSFPWKDYLGEESACTAIVIADGITSIADGAFYVQSYSGEITSAVLPETLKTIGDYAFTNCGVLATKIPSSVTEIGAHAFHYAFGYYTIDLLIPVSVRTIGAYAFTGNVFRSVTIENGVESIGEHAFCAKMGSEGVVFIPASVEKIDNGAFTGDARVVGIVDILKFEVDEKNENYCAVDGVLYSKDQKKLVQYPVGRTDTSYTIPDTVDEIQGRAFYGSVLERVDISDNVKKIGEYAFSDAYLLSTVNIPVQLEKLEEGIFYGCNLTELFVPETIIEIGACALYDNPLNKIELPQNITTIGDYALASTDLLSIRIPDGVRTIGNGVFENCRLLTNIEMPESLQIIGDSAFEYCTSLTNIELPQDLQTIGDSAFAECRSLVDIELPESLQTIGFRTFYDCDALVEISIPSRVTVISEEAFYCCDKLFEVILGEGVEIISQSAFASCPELFKMTMPESIQKIESYAFSNCDDLIGIEYGGSCAQWEEIKVEDGNDILEEILIHCVDGWRGLLEKDFGTAEPVEPAEPEFTFEVEWLSYGMPAEGMPLIDSGEQVQIFLCEEFIEKYQDLFVKKEDESKVFKGAIYFWDENEYCIGVINGPEVTAEGEIRQSLARMYVVEPNQKVEVQIVDSEKNVLAYGETNTFPYRRFSFTNAVRKIPDWLVKKFFGEFKGNLQLIANSGDNSYGSGGLCFGMAVATSLINYDSVSILDFCSNGSLCRALETATWETETAISSDLREAGIKNMEEFIMWCFLLQRRSDVEDSLEVSTSEGINGLINAIDCYKNGKAAMPVINLIYKERGRKDEIKHGVVAYDYESSANKGVDVIDIKIYDNNKKHFAITTIKVFDDSGNGDLYWEYPGYDYDTINIQWFIPAGNKQVNLDYDAIAFKSILYTRETKWLCSEGIQKQEIKRTANAAEGETVSEEENDVGLTWVWGDGTVTVEKQTEDIMLADDYALYTVKSAEQTEFSLQNGNTAEAAVFGPGELCYSCEYSTEEGNVVVEFTGTSEEGVRMSYSGTNVKFSGIGEGTVTVSYENGSVWSKNIGTDGESEAVVNADGVNQPTDSEGKIWEDTKGEPVIPPKEEDEVVRISGKTRYETGYAVADALKEVLGAEKFEAVVVATGKNFADALAGSYLAVERHAPILLTNGKDDNVEELHAYIKANVAEGGKVYILGGDSAVPEAVDAIEGYEVERLFGDSRYDTNLEILKEAGVAGDSIIVATGKTFADSLSASAAKLPILLVKPDAALNDAQKAILAGRKNIYIVGGEGAVSTSYEAELKEFGEVTRVFGESRYDTSVAAAKAFCTDVDKAVVASGKNFPDALCGGPLAAALNAPLVLTKGGGASVAAAYVAENKIASGYVLGGDGALADDTVVDVFALESAEDIK